MKSAPRGLPALFKPLPPPLGGSGTELQPSTSGSPSLPPACLWMTPANLQLWGVYDHNCRPSQKPYDLDDTLPPTQAVSHEVLDMGDLFRMEAPPAVGDTVPPQC